MKSQLGNWLLRFNKNGKVKKYIKWKKTESVFTFAGVEQT